MNYLWIDLEMSGLDAQKCRILEVAAIITDAHFNPLEEYHTVVFQPDSVLAAMDQWCTENHGKSGLTAQVPKGKKEDLVEMELLVLINKYFATDERPILSGNSIGQDRKFIDLYMPKLSQKLHYRMLDVTSYKVVFQNRFQISYTKKGSHRALDDIHESIAELNHYLNHIQIKS